MPPTPAPVGLVNSAATLVSGPVLLKRKDWLVKPLIANGSTVRVTPVDNCGRPDCNAGGAFVTDCWVSIEMEAEIDEGEDVEFKAANGKLCGVKPACPTLKYYNITANFWEASPELMSIMTASPEVENNEGDVVGFDSCSVACRSGFALEIWAEVLNAGDECAEDDDGEGAWMYILIPWVTQGVLGNLEIGAEAVQFELTAKSRASAGKTKNGKAQGWGEGPWPVQRGLDGRPGPMLKELGKGCHRRMMIVDVPPPGWGDTEDFPEDYMDERYESYIPIPGCESENESESDQSLASFGESSTGESSDESGAELLRHLLADAGLLTQLKKELAGV